MRAPLRQRAGWWGRLALAVLTIVVGLETPWIALPLVPLALAIALAGTVWLAWTLARPAPWETEAPRGRKRLALTVSSSMVALVAVLISTTSIRSCSSRPAREPWRQGAALASHRIDRDIGWGPHGPPEIVGQRLQAMDPSRPRVLLVGDSIVFGEAMSETEEVGHQLELLLDGHQVLNGGVSGYSIDQYMMTVDRAVPAVTPRLVVVGVFTGNDYQLTGREFTWGTRKPVFAVEEGALVRVDRAGDCITQLSQSVLFSALWSDRNLARTTIESLCDPIQLSRSELERSIPAMFDEIDAIAATHGARVLYVLLPTEHEVSTALADERYWFTGRHLDLWHLIGADRERYDFTSDALSPAHRGADLFLEDHAHLTSAGHALLARCLHREITQRRLLAPAP